MPTTPTRRKLLAAVGAATATGLAGCTAAERARLNPFAEPPISMTVVRATGDESETRCSLDADAVAEIAVLQNPLDELADAEDGERIHRGLSIEKGREISNMFTRQCDGEIGGIYRYEGAAYLIGLTYRDQADHQDHHEHLATETDNDTATDDTETPTPAPN